MATSKITSVTITHVYDDGSTNDFKLEYITDASSPVVSVRSDENSVWIIEESWPHVREAIDQLFIENKEKGHG